jgi:hypothetical protein
MRRLRLRLRHLAAVWLLVQATSLAAFVPRECCKAHLPNAPEVPACHKKAIATHANQSETCNLRARCEGPMAVLAAFLPTHGILPNPMALQPELPSRAVPLSSSERLIRRLSSPDTPPPRS